MSIQRYDFFGPSNNYPLGGMNEAMLGHWVRYADHVAAVKHAERIGYALALGDNPNLVARQQGVLAERARIRQAVEALEGSSEISYDYPAYSMKEIMFIIDGEEEDRPIIHADGCPTEFNGPCRCGAYYGENND